MPQPTWPQPPPIPPSSPPPFPRDIFLSQPASLEPVRKVWVTGASDLPEAVPVAGQTTSYFDHDDQGFLRSLSRGAKFGSGGTHSSADAATAIEPKWHRFVRKPVFIATAALCVLVLVVGGVLGGVFGTMANAGRNSAEIATQNVPEQQPKGIGNAALAVPHEQSQLVTAAAGDASSGFRVVVFQDASGELVVIESRGSAREVYFLSSRLGDAEPPMPIGGSPMSFVNFGVDGDLHLFYIDDALKFSHVVRRSKLTDEDSWEIGELSAAENRAEMGFQASETLRLSTTILPANWANMTEDYLVIFCQSQTGEDTIQLLSTTDPDDFGAWTQQSLAVGTDDPNLQFHPSSSGLLILPVERALSEDEIIAGIRMIWDLANDSHKTTFGIFDCTFVTAGSITDCTKVENKWEDYGAEDHVLDAIKPLHFSTMTVGAAETEDPSTMFIRVIDSDGELLELRWDESAWTDHGVLTIDTETMPENVTTSLTSACSTEDETLYAMAGGQIVEFARINSWWEDGYTGPGWKFVDFVDMTLA